MPVTVEGYEGERLIVWERDSVGSKKSILVVDDDGATRDTLRLILESEGYDVLYAADGSSALEQLGRHRPSLILLDLMMLTGASQPWLKAEWVGAEAYLEKPFEVSKLLDEVGRLTAA